MEQAAALLHKYPELRLFLSIVLVHVIGRFHSQACQSRSSNDAVMMQFRA